MAGCLAIVLLCACPGGAGEDPTPTPGPTPWTVTELALPTVAGAQTPLLTRTADGDVLASWVEPDGDLDALRFAWLRAGSKSWDSPKTAATGTDWTQYWADGPSVVPRDDGGYVAHWFIGMDGGGYGAMVTMSDDGDSWTTPLLLHDDDAAVEHGYVRFTSLPDGRVLGSWLDGREWANGNRETQLIARVIDTDGTLGPELVGDDRTCDCCPMDAVALPDGRALVVYRDRDLDEVRDIAAATLTDSGFEAPELVHQDGWEIHGCPTNGPQVDGEGEHITAVWFTNANADGKAQLALSSDGGDTFSTPVLIDDDNILGRVSAVSLGADGGVAGWITRDAAGMSLLVRRVDAQGIAADPQRVAVVLGGFSAPQPRMERFGDGLVFMYYDPKGELRSATTPLP